MKASISTVVAAVIAAAAASAGSAGISGSGTELLVVGPVEAVNPIDRTAIVLGQRVQTDMAERLAVGDTVAVFGVTRGDGSIAAAAIQSRGTYVPGATAIFLSGRVESAQPAIGHVVLNGVHIDLTSAMAHGMFSPAVGTKLSVSGTQPVSHGLVLVNGISGSGTSGISGSGGRVSGISGSGTSGISGSGTSGVKAAGARLSGLIRRVSGISGSGSPQ